MKKYERNMKKYLNTWKSIQKHEKTWKSIQKHEKVFKNMKKYLNYAPRHRDQHL